MTKEEREVVRERFNAIKEKKFVFRGNEFLTAAILSDIPVLLDALEAANERADMLEAAYEKIRTIQDEIRRLTAEGESCAGELRYWINHAESAEAERDRLQKRVDALERAIQVNPGTCFSCIHNYNMAAFCDDCAIGKSMWVFAEAIFSGGEPDD